MIFQSENLLTVLGVIFLSVAYGFNMSYVSQKQNGSIITDKIIPLGLNIAISLFLAFGLLIQPAIDSKVKLLFIIFLVVLVYAEIYYVTKKPSSKVGIPVAYMVLTFGAFIKLYLLIALHCGVSSELSKTILTILQQKATSKVAQPRAEPRIEPRVEARVEERTATDYGNLNQKLVNELKVDTSKSREQKLVELNKLRAQFDRSALTLEEMADKYKLGGRSK
jgi:hypothetical protein